nr:hypothetical protein [uncultured Desulfobulbus sp.]
MKSYVQRFVFCCLIVACIGISGPALASQWMMAHGNAAVIEYPSNCSYHYYGWGLDLTQNSGQWNWIHIPIPTKYWGAKARYLLLKFYRGSADALVSQIDVYNGNEKVKVFTTVSSSVGWNSKIFDLGSLMTFSRGCSVSIKIGAGVESMSHRFIFSTAGAKFEP